MSALAGAGGRVAHQLSVSTVPSLTPLLGLGAAAGTPDLPNSPESPLNQLALQGLAMGQRVSTGLKVVSVAEDSNGNQRYVGRATDRACYVGRNSGFVSAVFAGWLSCRP